MKKLIWFIINPISGTGKQKHATKLIHEYLDHSLFEYEIKYTSHPGQIKELCKEGINKKVDVIGVIGGDGSVNEAASALRNSDVAMAIIPMGSGNGLAQHLQIPISFKDSLQIINQQKLKVIDTAEVNNRPFIGVSGVGFDALIAQKFGQSKKRGLWTYVSVILRNYLSYQTQKYMVTCDNEQFEIDGFLVTVANSSKYGNRVTIAPEACINDGLLDLCILRPFPFWMGPLLALKLFGKRINRSKYMLTKKAKMIRLEHKGDLVHVDGEPIIQKGPHQFSIIPESLTVICP